nr:reverse transcriptase domain-containing protein [Tanacetum cinerariifolium]
MRTRSSKNRIVESSTIPRRRNKRSQQQVTPTIVEILVVTMPDNRTMEEMLQAPTEGYEDAIVVPDILAENFEIKTGLLSLIQANQFHSFKSNNPHDHMRSFNRITSTLKFRNVPNDAIKLMLFPYSLEGAAKIWYEKEPPRSILTWGDLVIVGGRTIYYPVGIGLRRSCEELGGAGGKNGSGATVNLNSGRKDKGFVELAELVPRVRWD